MLAGLKFAPCGGSTGTPSHCLYQLPSLSGSCDLKKIYPVLCEELAWKPYAWQTLAPHMRELTGGRKTYKYVDGERRRVYFVEPTIAKQGTKEIAAMAA